MFDANSVVAEDGSPDKRSIPGYSQPKIRVHSEKGSEASPSHKYSSSSFSPAKHKNLRFVEPRRISFYSPGSHPFVENFNDGSKTSTIHINYDDFFSANATVAEESGRNATEENDQNNEQADQESVSSQSSSNLDFDELLKKIDELTSEQHEIIIQRLLKKRETNKI